MDERGMWEQLRPSLVTLGLDPIRVENALGVGTPDVNYTSGWIELKYLESWPAPLRVVRIPSLWARPGQVAWLTRRWRAGGPCWLLVRVGPELLLFAGLDSASVRRGLTRGGYHAFACWRADVNKLNLERMEALRAWLTWRAEDLRANERAKLDRLRSNMTIHQAADHLSWNPASIEAAEAVYGPASEDLLAAWEC